MFTKHCYIGKKTFDVCGYDMSRDRVLSANICIQPPGDPAHSSDGDSGDEENADSRWLSRHQLLAPVTLDMKSPSGSVIIGSEEAYFIRNQILWLESLDCKTKRATLRKWMQGYISPLLRERQCWLASTMLQKFSYSSSVENAVHCFHKGYYSLITACHAKWF